MRSSAATQINLDWLETLSHAEASALLTSLEESDDREACERSLAEFTRGAWHILEPGTPLIWNWHLDALCGYLEAVEAGKIQNLIINIPPGTMKSMIVSVMWPAWVFIRRPWWRFLCGSNEQGLAVRDATKTRLIIRSDWYQRRWGTRIGANGEPEPWVRIDPGQDEKTLFATTQRGFRQSLGVLAKVTGKRGDCILWDDPHDTQQVESDVQRKEVLSKWDISWSSRLNSQATGWRIFVMQRMHVQDMTGHVTKAGTPEKWVKLVIPMRYDPDNTYDPDADIGRPDLADPRTKEGELLFPALFPEVAVSALETRLGPYGTAGQLQQRPNPKGGGEFKREWIMHYHRKPVGGNRYILVDPAGERRAGATGRKDNTAMGVVELGADQNYYLIDAYRDRLNLADRTRILFEWHRKYQPLGVGYEHYGMQSDIAHIRQMQEQWSYRFKITELGGSMRKEDRIRRLIPLFEAGRIWLPESLHRTDWNGQTVDLIQLFIEQEYLPFPVAAFDDMIDMLSRIVDPDMKAQFPRAPRTQMNVQDRDLADPGVGY